MDVNADTVGIVQSETEDSKVSEQVQILKNEADWAEKQQLESEKEIVELKNVIDQLSEELQKTQIVVNTKDFKEMKLTNDLFEKEKEIRQLTAEIQKITNESYNYKTKLCFLSSKNAELETKLFTINNEKIKAEEVIELLNREIELMKFQSSKNMQELTEAEEAKSQNLIEENKKLAAELDVERQQKELLEKSLKEKNEALHASLEREKQFNDAREQYESQAKVNSLSYKRASDLEEEIEHLHSVNKALREKLSQEFSGLPSSLLTQDARPICTQHLKDTLKCYEESNQEFRKQLVLAKSKVLKLEKELMECGLRPAKRTLLQSTLSTQNKQRVPFTPARVDKENTDSLASSNLASLTKTTQRSLLHNVSTPASTSECFQTGAMSAKK